MTSVILSVAEVVQITGYQQASRQLKWFSERGYRASLNARNECVVFRSDLETRAPDRPKVRLLQPA